MAISSGSGVWRPRDHNFSDQGYVTLRTGLEYSRNTVTIRIAEALGIEPVGDLLERAGIYEDAPDHSSLALGAVGTSLLDIVSAFSVIAGDGLVREPVLIRELTQNDLLEAPGTAEGEEPSEQDEGDQDRPAPLFDPVTRAQLVSMLGGVTEYGTAWRAFDGADYKVHGKTGTTNGAKDTWFIGFTGELVVGVYIGFDEPARLGRGETGGNTAAPIVRTVFDALPPEYRESNYELPAGAEIVEVDPATGIPTPGGFPEIMRRLDY